MGPNQRHSCCGKQCGPREPCTCNLSFGNFVGSELSFLYSINLTEATPSILELKRKLEMTTHTLPLPFLLHTIPPSSPVCGSGIPCHNWWSIHPNSPITRRCSRRDMDRCCTSPCPWHYPGRAIHHWRIPRDIRPAQTMYCR